MGLLVLFKHTSVLLTLFAKIFYSIFFLRMFYNKSQALKSKRIKLNEPKLNPFSTVLQQTNSCTQTLHNRIYKKYTFGHMYISIPSNIFLLVTFWSEPRVKFSRDSPDIPGWKQPLLWVHRGVALSLWKVLRSSSSLDVCKDSHRFYEWNNYNNYSFLEADPFFYCGVILRIIWMWWVNDECYLVILSD